MRKPFYHKKCTVFLSKTLIDQSLDKWMDRNTWEHEKIYENYIDYANRCDLGSYFNQQTPKNVTNSALAVASSSSKYCDICAYVPTIFSANMSKLHMKIIFLVIASIALTSESATSNCKKSENNLCSKCEQSQYSKVETCVGKCSDSAQKFCQVSAYQNNIKKNETICSCGTNMKDCQVSLDSKICDVCKTGFATVYKTNSQGYITSSTCVKNQDKKGGDQNTCKNSKSNLITPPINPITSCKTCETFSANRYNCTSCNSNTVKACEDNDVGRVCRCSNSDSCGVKKCEICVNPDIRQIPGKQCAVCKPGYTTVWQNGKNTVCRSGTERLLFTGFAVILVLVNLC